MRSTAAGKITEKRREALDAYLEANNLSDNFSTIQNIRGPSGLNWKPNGEVDLRVRKIMTIERWRDKEARRWRNQVVFWGVEKQEDKLPDDLEPKVKEAVLALRATRRILDHRNGRAPAVGRRFAPKHIRPAAFRAVILEEAAKVATEHYGRPVSKRTVEAAWKETRSLQRWLRSELGDTQ